MIAALILAAGESARMKIPKALLKIGDETFGECIARKIRAIGVETIFVVVGDNSEEIRQELRGKHGLDFIVNPHYQEGQLSSLKQGLRNLPAGTTEALIWPVDQPLVKVETARKLLEAFRRERRRLTIPVHQSHKGHPVVYDSLAIHEVFSLKRTQTAKDLQEIFAANTSLVEVDDPGILIDIDTPEDYRRHISEADS